MVTENFKFLSNDGKTNIHAVKWIPDSGEYKGIIQITHGMVEYIERYEGFAEFLTDNGFMVVGHDHLGHGESVTSKENWGFFTENNPSDTLVEDMHKLRTTIQKDNKDVAYFMFGHSMGSYMLRKYLAKYNSNLNGAIICGTGFSPVKTTMMGMKVVSLFKKFRGWHYRSQTVANLTYDKYYKKFDLTGKDVSNSWLTRNEAVVETYYADPKCTFLFTLNGYQGLTEAVLFTCKQENVDKIPNSLPIFIISGDDDPVGALGEGVKTVYRMFKQSGKKDLSYKLYPGFRHEILNEIGKEEVYQDVLLWACSRL